MRYKNAQIYEFSMANMEMEIWMEKNPNSKYRTSYM